MLNSNKVTSDNYLGNINLKKCGVQIDYTPQQIKELQKCAKDVIYFAENYCKIVTVDDGEQPFKPRDYQKQLIMNAVNNRFSIAKIPRQYGKCNSRATLIKIRNKNTGDILELTVEELFNIK